MKRLIILWTLLLLPLFAGAQFSIDSVGFQVYRADIYQGQDTEEGFFANKRNSYNVDVLVYIEDGKMTNKNMRGQLKSMRFQKEPKYFSNLAEGVPGYEIESKDFGGFNCVISIFYLQESNSYRIRMDYSNLRIFLYANPTNERPWDDQTDLMLVKDAQSWPDNPDYTDEEVIAYFKKLMNGDEVSKAIAKALIFDAVNEF
jgi:hypothetical protein